ncbi:MAG TPA: xanthine dehydrogenase family protein molybdopterin-binding subunit [Vicinamibacterales bacterium]|nr:xanthine dehydrogenase family protein molybdopterin-binding subunit [Vicinamibacterales bacterium]
MGANRLIGQNYLTPDLVAKVTGQAKYAEDYRVDGMLFARLLLSPMPHARVTHIDASEAMKMPGVKGILTADELPAPADVVTDLGQTIKANLKGERALTNEPLYQGEPILALAAVDEQTAMDAIEKIQVEYEALPFAVDPLATLRPGSPSAREGNIWGRPAPPQGRGGAPGVPDIQEWKWTDADFADYDAGKLPMGKPTDEWTYGDIDAGFKNAALVLDETFVTPNTSHQTLETRTAMAYWRAGKLFMHCSTQSTVQTVASVSRWLGIPQENIVLISAYTGGGFGSKASGTITCMIPALLSKKLNAPVMMRISREEEHGIGGARPSLHGRMKVGFTTEGRITAVDMFVVCENGPYEQQGDAAQSGRIVSLLYQPPAMRWRGITVLTNTPTRRAQSQPGGMQGVTLMEPVVAKAARKLGVDQVTIRRMNAPEGKAPFGPAAPNGTRAHSTSAFIKEALDRGKDLFKWDERQAMNGKKTGTKVRGLGVAMSCFVAGSTGYDGLFVIKPDGKMYIQSGVGNLGTETFSDCNRVAAELVGMPWENVELAWGDTSLNLPWTCVSGGSQTTHAMTRAAHAAGSDARAKLQEMAAKDLGGKPEDYEIAKERVFHKSSGRGMTLAQAATRAIELGGVYDGHELPTDINAFTVRSATALAGQGLMAVARDNYKHDGQTLSYVAGFAEVEVDVETGKYDLLDYLAVADVGTVIHPRTLGGQVLGRSMLGIGHAIGQKWVYDQHYGVPLAKRFYQNKPPTILDAPQHMAWDAVNRPDPETPVGARGIGEPPVGAGCNAILNAITAAVGDEVVRRAPVTLDAILLSLEAGHPVGDPLTAHI